VNAHEARQLETAIDTALAACDLGQAEILAARYRERAGSRNSSASVAHSFWFRAAYLSAQVSLAAGRLTEAAELLEPLGHLTGDLPLELACRVRLLTAEAYARLRRLSEARRYLNPRDAQMVERHPLLWLRTLRLRLWLGEVKEVEEQVARCARALEHADDRANLALLTCEEGLAWYTAGDLERAEACWSRAEGLLRSKATPPAVDPICADVLLQLGRLEHLKGRLQAALDRYQSALACVPAQTPQEQELRLRRLLVLLDLNQWNQVRAEFERLPSGGGFAEEVQGLARMIRALLGQEIDPGASAELRGYLQAARGDLQAAQQLYQEALQETSSPERQARLSVALGMLALGSKDCREAEPRLRQAEMLARQHHLPEVLWRALQARGHLVAEAEGREDQARSLFEEAVLVSEVQARLLLNPSDRAAYHLHRTGVLRHLLQAACRRGDVAAAFRYQELDRGRLLLELWRSAPQRCRGLSLPGTPELAELDRQIAECERSLGGVARPSETMLRHYEELLLRRDRVLEGFLRDRSHTGSAALPTLVELDELEQMLPSGTVYLAPSLVQDDLFLLVARQGAKSRVIAAPGTAALLRNQLSKFRECVSTQIELYRRGFLQGSFSKAELDRCLEDLGQGPLGEVLIQALGQRATGERLIWVPDAELHGLPLHALRRSWTGQENVSYLIEHHEIVQSFGGSLFVHQARTRRRRFGRALVVTESPSVLPTASREGEGVAAAFLWKRVLSGPRANRDEVRRLLSRARVAHFACHAYFDSQHPLAACIGLPSGENWRALEWLDEPLAGLPLVTLSACRSAEVAPLVGREVFGLVTGLLGSGVRAVLAGLWPVADRETPPLMWLFYRERMTHDLATALARAQRAALAWPDASPLYWAAFALFGDAAALPAAGLWRRWWQRWRQRRYARRFPVPDTSPV
jgi:tetratricopeptide (TPR) repeat protein